LGRLANCYLPAYLLGKGKPTVTPHIDGGDYVIVINSANLVVTGKKQTDKNTTGTAVFLAEYTHGH
jgi:large subunit ribosomal protein L13